MSFCCAVWIRARKDARCRAAAQTAPFRSISLSPFSVFACITVLFIAGLVSSPLRTVFLRHLTTSVHRLFPTSYSLPYVCCILRKKKKKNIYSRWTPLLQADSSPSAWNSWAGLSPYLVCSMDAAAFRIFLHRGGRLLRDFQRCTHYWFPRITCHTRVRTGLRFNAVLVLTFADGFVVARCCWYIFRSACRRTPETQGFCGFVTMFLRFPNGRACLPAALVCQRHSCDRWHARLPAAPRACRNAYTGRFASPLCGRSAGRFSEQAARSADAGLSLDIQTGGSFVGRTTFHLFSVVLSGFSLFGAASAGLPACWLLALPLCLHCRLTPLRIAAAPAPAPAAPCCPAVLRAQPERILLRTTAAAFDAERW